METLHYVGNDATAASHQHVGHVGACAQPRGMHAADVGHVVGLQILQRAVFIACDKHGNDSNITFECSTKHRSCKLLRTYEVLCAARTPRQLSVVCAVDALRLRVHNIAAAL
jgi:hypothetical protein